MAERFLGSETGWVAEGVFEHPATSCSLSGQQTVVRSGVASEENNAMVLLENEKVICEECRG